MTLVRGEACLWEASAVLQEDQRRHLSWAAGNGEAQPLRLWNVRAPDG